MLTLRESAVTLRPMVPESFVAWLWEGRRVPAALETGDGRPVQVIYPGWRLASWGPDYSGALLSIGGELVRGDVELHVRSRDWHAHGHGTDPAFDSTILHIVYSFEAGLPAVRSDGVVVPTVFLEPLVAANFQSLWTEWQRQEGPASPAPQACRSPAEAGWLLDRAGDERFEAKAARFEGDLAIVTPEQAWWTGLLESLGYSANVAPFRALAEQVSWETADWLHRCHGATALEASLLGAAGLLPAQRGRLALDDESQRLEQAWRDTRDLVGSTAPAIPVGLQACTADERTSNSQTRQAANRPRRSTNAEWSWRV
jgi:hypothetical protein